MELFRELTILANRAEGAGMMRSRKGRKAVCSIRRIAKALCPLKGYISEVTGARWAKPHIQVVLATLRWLERAQALTDAMASMGHKMEMSYAQYAMGLPPDHRVTAIDDIGKMFELSRLQIDDLYKVAGVSHPFGLKRIEDGAHRWSARPTPEFWDAWQNDKEGLLFKGYYVVKSGGEWRVLRAPA